jgi:hypothetical protein
VPQLTLQAYLMQQWRSEERGANSMLLQYVALSGIKKMLKNEWPVF